MSSTLAVERKEARRLARDTDLGHCAVSTREFNRLIEGLMHSTGNAIGLYPQWANAVVSYSSSSPDVVLPASGVQYRNIHDVRRTSDKFPLAKWTRVEIEFNRQGTSYPSSTVGPIAYAIMEDTDHTITLLLDSLPSVAGTLDILRSIIPASLADSDAAVIPFDRDLLEGFRAGCAVRAITLMTDAERATRGFENPNNNANVLRMQEEYREAVKKAKIRIERHKRADTLNATLYANWIGGNGIA